MTTILFIIQNTLNHPYGRLGETGRRIIEQVADHAGKDK